MFESSSRYTECENSKLTLEDGRIITYKKRRFMPPGNKMHILQEIVVAAGDRLDLIAALTLGDPEQFWRICDANYAMHPLELTSEIGRSLRIAMPWK